MNVFRSAQLYRRRNQASHAMPRPEAILLPAMALRAYEPTVKAESGEMEKTAVSTLKNRAKISILFLLRWEMGVLTLPMPRANSCDDV